MVYQTLRQLFAIVILVVGAASTTWATNAFQESGGQVVMEAEHYDGIVSRSAHDWTLETAKAGFAGTGYLSVLPNSGTAINTGYVTTSPELVFNVNFTTTGTYYVWVRGGADSGTDDSCHAGLDGTGPASADRISGLTTTSWVWKRDTMDAVPATLVISTPGLHTIHLWMREDGLRVDRLLLRKSSSSTAPSGTGPAESPITVVDTLGGGVPSGTSILSGTEIPPEGYTFTDNVLDAGDTWDVRAPLPTPRAGIVVASVGGRVYVIGGSVNNTPVATVEAYDPSTDSWTSKAPMPTARSLAAATVLNGQIYVLGGRVGDTAILPTVEAYDPATDAWTVKSSMPTARMLLAAAALNNKIYAFGGHILISGSPADVLTDVIEEYDAGADSWMTKAPLPKKRDNHSAIAFNARIYLLGGTVVEAGSLKPTNAVDEYDPVSESWTPRTAMLLAQGINPTAALLDDDIYAFGNGSSVNYVFDIPTATWKTRTPPPIVVGGGAGVVDGKIYLVPQDGKVGTPTQVYTPSIPLYVHEKD